VIYDPNIEWIKVFYDGTEEVCHSIDFRAKKISWKNGRQDIKSGTIYLNGHSLQLHILEAEEYKPSFKLIDKNLHSFSKNSSIVISRTLECDLLEEVGISFSKRGKSSFFAIGKKVYDQDIPEGSKKIRITLHRTGRTDVGFE
jgi:hypothetical protein